MTPHTVTTTATRSRAAHRVRRSPYPHDYLHADRPYPDRQRDIGAGLLLGAILLVALMALIGAGVI